MEMEKSTHSSIYWLHNISPNPPSIFQATKLFPASLHAVMTFRAGTERKAGE